MTQATFFPLEAHIAAPPAVAPLEAATPDTPAFDVTAHDTTETALVTLGYGVWPPVLLLLVGVAAIPFLAVPLLIVLIGAAFVLPYRWIRHHRG